MEIIFVVELRGGKASVDGNDVILWIIQREFCQKCGKLWYTLDVIKDQQRDRGLERFFGIGLQEKQRILGRPGYGEIICHWFVSFEVEIEGVFVIFFCKIQGQPGFTGLPQPLEKERMAVGIFFPLDQGISTFSAHIGSSCE